MNRVVDPEWLDELPPGEIRARHSRLDLRRLNRILGHARSLARALTPVLELRLRPSLVDIGAGDGSFALSLVRHLPPPREGGEFILVDNQEFDDTGLAGAFAERGWALRVLRVDVFSWLESDESGPCDVILANLFLHHFPETPLKRLLNGISLRSSCFAACETRRGPIPLLASRLVGLVGCRAVTRHDAVVSVRAGFRGNELTRLWPAHDNWRLQELRLGWCSHWFMARKQECQEN